MVTQVSTTSVVVVPSVAEVTQPRLIVSVIPLPGQEPVEVEAQVSPVPCVGATPESPQSLMFSDFKKLSTACQASLTEAGNAAVPTSLNGSAAATRAASRAAAVS